MKAKKSLGQNFLNSSGVVASIIKAGDLAKEDIVLEIGPGKGIITRKLLEHAGKVIAIEKDAELVQKLQEIFANEIADKRLILICGDILDFDLKKMKKFGKNYKVVANIPYYITGAILKKLLTANFKPSSITLLVQKEIAERIVARDPKPSVGQGGKESILSISVKVYGEPIYVKKVARGNFTPSPNVDSAILHIKNIGGKNFKNVAKEERFFQLLHLGFGHKRKKLFKNLSAEVNIEKLRKVFVELGISEEIRAERLTLEDWLSINARL